MKSFTFSTAVCLVLVALTCESQPYNCPSVCGFNLMPVCAVDRPRRLLMTFDNDCLRLKHNCDYGTNFIRLFDGICRPISIPPRDDPKA
ncbi:vasotab-TY1-like [Frankliniella occidentalis]|uniref:Vasotab-TY1-like n=1 Tax=Frankliniella occidentalis TaxID=133901 RepID=A0A9C6TPU0_FRAOC|nr:vasotab-TY1-like [Frankliniella occidentalis]